MPDWLSRFRQIIWPAVAAAGAAAMLLVGGPAGWSIETVVALGFAGMILATLSLRN